MSNDNNGLAWLLVGGVIVYAYLYFTGKVGTKSTGGIQTGSSLPVAGSTCGTCGSGALAPGQVAQQQSNSLDVEGRYITAIAVPAPSIIS